MTIRRRDPANHRYMVPIFVRLRAEWRIRFLLLFVHHFLPSDRSLAHAAMKNWIFRVCAAGERSTTGRHATINVPLLKMVTVHFSRSAAAAFDPHNLNLAGRKEYGAFKSLVQYQQHGDNLCHQLGCLHLIHKIATKHALFLEDTRLGSAKTSPKLVK